MSEKPRTDAVLKNLSPEDQEQLWLLRTTPQVRRDEDNPKSPLRPMTQQEVREREVPMRFGFTVSSGSFSEWESWYQQKLRIEAAMARAEQAKLDWLKKNPDASTEDLERLGQMVFTNESVENGDLKGFVALMKANNVKRKLELDERRVKLLEEKAAKADEIEALMKKRKKEGGGLTEETLEEIERALGM